MSIKTHRNFILLFGFFGSRKIECRAPLKIIQINPSIYFGPLVNSHKRKDIRQAWGTFRSMFYRLAYGLSNQFHFFLDLTGVGFKIIRKKKKLILKLGTSHLQFLTLPLSSTFKLQRFNKRPLRFQLTDGEYEVLRGIISFIKRFKRPGMYKKKGFTLSSERLAFREGKKVKA